MTETNRKYLVRFGQRIQSMRKERGWTLDRLANEIGSSKSHVWAIEGGHSAPTLPTLRALALAFNTDLNGIAP